MKAKFGPLVWPTEDALRLSKSATEGCDITGGLNRKWGNVERNWRGHAYGMC